MTQKKAKYFPAGSNEWQEKFVNCMMQRGKKSISRSIFADAMSTLKKQGVTDPDEVFKKALQNVMPNMEVRAQVSTKDCMQVSFQCLRVHKDSPLFLNGMRTTRAPGDSILNSCLQVIIGTHWDYLSIWN